jgi:FkbM family methyltransferase
MNKLIWPAKVLWNKIKFLFVTGPGKQSREDAETFFSQQKNWERVQEVASWLADPESKKTYLRQIMLRRKGKRIGYIHYHGGEQQYFVNSFFHYGNEEVLVDCGAYTGDTIECFLKVVPNYKKIYAFEPDAKNFSSLRNHYGDFSKVELLNAGAWNVDGKLSFDSQGTTGGQINASGEGSQIDVRSIDSLQIPEKVTLIKMDIEGAEWEALQGAEQTILRDKPKLAICIYHSNEDMVRLAEYIHALVPEYKLRVRQHHPFWPRETVLYAQIENWRRK